MRTLLILLLLLLPLLACQRPGASVPAPLAPPEPTTWLKARLGDDIKVVTAPSAPFAYALSEACPLSYEWRGAFEQRESMAVRRMKLTGAFTLSATKDGLRAKFEDVHLERQLQGPDVAPVKTTPTLPEVAVLTRVKERRGLVEVGAPSTGWRGYGTFRGVGPLFPTLPKESSGSWAVSLQDPSRLLNVGRTKDAGQTETDAGLETVTLTIERGDWFETPKGRVLVTRARAEGWTVLTALHEKGYVLASQLLQDVPGPPAQRLDAEIRLTKGCEATPSLAPTGAEWR